jgi:hypothetical protein
MTKAKFPRNKRHSDLDEINRLNQDMKNGVRVMPIQLPELVVSPK